MGFYFSNKDRCVPSAPRADEKTKLICGQIHECEKALEKLEKSRTKIIYDFGDKYTSDIDSRIKKLKGKIIDNRIELKVYSQTEKLFQCIINELGLTYQFGFINYRNNDNCLEFNPVLDYSIYSFNSKSGGHLAMRQDVYCWGKEERIKFEIKYVYDDGDTSDVLTFEWQPGRKDPIIKQDEDVGTCLKQSSSYDDYQVAEFFHTRDVVKQMLDEFIQNYVSLQAEEDRLMEQRMAYTAAILTDTCVDSVEE